MTEDEMVGWHHRRKLSKFWEIVENRAAWCAVQSLGSQKVRHNLAIEEQQ